MLVQIHANMGWYGQLCGQSCDGTLKLALSEEWTDGINWFFACWYWFTKIKSWLKIYWVGKVRNGCDHSGHGTLKLTVSQNWADGTNWFFYKLLQIQESWKLIQSFLSGPCQKWQWLFSSWDPKTCCILMNIWIELISLMLIVMQYFLVRLISYSLTFKCWGSTAVLLLVLRDIFIV